ncbi:MAG: hypothetical protein CMH61_00750 [Nanoarchaeota archaeon]|nr:hypothetical protein [Nanoarchaeota archaeon]|tara:strand:+ start:1666 stop:2241 length:576 start_codon:yes stop_codon:yes gene_type:complete
MKKGVIITLLFASMFILAACSGKPLAGKAVATPVADCQKIEETHVLAVQFNPNDDWIPYEDECTGNILKKGICDTSSSGRKEIKRESVNCEWGCEKATCLPEPEPVDVPGCIDGEADNFNALATVDDGSCTYAPECTPDDPEFCQNQAACEDAGLHWWSDDTCLDRPEPEDVPQPEEEAPVEEVPPEEDNP